MQKFFSNVRFFSPYSSLRGFTLVEAIVSIAIILLIGGSMIAFYRSVIMNTKVLQSSLNAQQQIRRVQQAFIAELRSATQSAGGAYTIESAGTSSIAFFSNTDADASIEHVRYFFATSTKGGPYNVLKKGVIKPTGTVYDPTLEKISTVVFDVKNSSTTPIFTYYDSTYNGTSSTTPLAEPINVPAIRLVKMSLAVDPNAGRSPVYQTYTTQVSIRNLKDNF